MPKHKARKQHRISQGWPLLIGAVLLIAAAGSTALLYTHAATRPASVEAENGTITASKVTDNTASNGAAVKFKSGASISLLHAVSSYTVKSNLSYGSYGTDNLLDIYVPNGSGGPYPTIVYVHGGGWQENDKNGCVASSSSPTSIYSLNRALVLKGFALVCISYRLTNNGNTPMPAQIIDTKAAIRYVRANGSKYGLYTDKLGVDGDSAGGHLGSLAGTAGDQTAWDVGSNLSYSSKIQGVADFFGPSDIYTDAQNNSSAAQSGSPEADLLGVSKVLDNQAIANAASPTTYIDASDPPFIIFHGTSDGTVPYSQSTELNSKLKAAGVSSTLYSFNGSDHEAAAIFVDSSVTTVTNFFDKILRQ